MADFFSIKGKVKEILENTLTDFEVTWGFTKRDVPRNWCYIGSLNWPDAEWATTRSREYQMTVPIILNAIRPRSTAEQAEAWLAPQVQSVIDAFERYSELRTIGVITWGVRPRDFRSQPHADGIEAQAALELVVTYR